jgi:hypothetical protein
MPRITGSKQVGDRLRTLAGKEKIELVGQALFAGAELIKAEASHLVTVNSVSGANHVVSLPHQPPNEDTGQLRSGFETARTGPLRAEFSSNAPHAVPLERGTHKMIERPHVGPAVKNKRKEIVEKVQRAVNIATRKRK